MLEDRSNPEGWSKDDSDGIDIEKQIQKSYLDLELDFWGRRSFHP